ncbi:hypothetical protein K466DRAFT_183033 [Polyporus arcularius HHB13444]|uniref:Secreted protein n=1 Tax=Polyporus arcularius HHB13444 TaxID=1314778 RepID=A0A5C3PAE4_9APHY|nr:hypothetical protein K466DRAFT_183033 [Polyporus arcularius HHB13444]
MALWSRNTILLAYLVILLCALHHPAHVAWLRRCIRADSSLILTYWFVHRHVARRSPNTIGERGHSSCTIPFAARTLQSWETGIVTRGSSYKHAADMCSASRMQNCASRK